METYQVLPIEQLIEQLEMAGRYPEQSLLAAILARREEATPLLLQIFDQSVDDDWEDDDPRWHRLGHAGNFLRYWKEPKALPLFVKLYDKHDDWCELFESKLYEYGEVAVEPFGAFISRSVDEDEPKKWRYGRSLTVGILGKIGLKFPETRERIVQILSSVLPPLEIIPTLTEDDCKSIWTEVVDSLGELQHEESRAQITALFEADLINSSIIRLNWYENEMAAETPESLKYLRSYDLLSDYENSYQNHLLWEKRKKAWQKEEAREQRLKERADKRLENVVQVQQGRKKIEKVVKIGRNEPCPCGSDKKYKKCCMSK